MLDMRALSDEELLRYCISQDSLTTLEVELSHRLEACVDTKDPILQENVAYENLIVELQDECVSLRQQIEDLSERLLEYDT